MSAMFQNALAAIRMGIEDYALDRPERSLSAVRNFYAGVLLLAKEVLVRRAPLADPDAVIGARYKPIPDGLGGIAYIPDSRTTIDFATLGKRFKDFGLEIDRASLTELSDIRNQVEHRFTNKPSQVVREIIAKAFPVTAQLFRLAGEDPRVQLGEAWTTMLEARALRAGIGTLSEDPRSRRMALGDRGRCASPVRRLRFRSHCAERPAQQRSSEYGVALPSLRSRTYRRCRDPRVGRTCVGSGCLYSDERQRRIWACVRVPRLR